MDDRMKDLAERVEAANGPDAEADYLIHALIMGWRTPDELNCFSWRVGENYQFGHPDDERRAIYVSESELPDYTASIDAAISLVPEGCLQPSDIVRDALSRLGKRFSLHVMHWPLITPYTEYLARFICAAALRSRKESPNG